MAQDVFVVTHTQATHHVEGLVGGWYDSDLTDLGVRQARAMADSLAARLGDRRPARILSSDLRRAARTAACLSERLGVPVVHTADLRERSYGVAGGRPVAWLLEHRVLSPKDGDRFDHRDGIEGAETRREFITRVYRAMDRVIGDAAPLEIVVTHGFALTFVVSAWIGLPLESAGRVSFRGASGGITHLHEDDEYFNRSVMSLNDTGHLAGL